MVTIIEDRCKGCGSCIDICHESCMFLLENKIHINYDFCSTCTQCISICPHLALQWEKVRPEPFNDDMLPSSKQIDELLKQRRTIRYFKEDKPDRQLIQEIVSYGAYAPTHNHDFRVIAVDNQNQLDQIDRIVYSYNKKIFKYLYKPKFIHLLVRLMPPAQQKEYMEAKPKLENSLKNEKGYYCIPPVILFIVGLKRVPLSLESAQYILYNVDLYARSKDLVCRNLVGYHMFFNSSKFIRDLLHIRKDEKIFATFGIGYPSKKFRNKVQGRKLEFQWNL